MQYQTVLCYIKQKDEYLMLHRNKKENDINKNKWIGVGGHIKENETPSDALIREVKEETGLELNSFTYKGLISFYLDSDLEICYVYTSSDFKGKLIECDEGSLKWVKISRINELELWPGDKVFLPLLEEEKTFKLKLIYKNNVLIDSKLQIK